MCDYTRANAQNRVWGRIEGVLADNSAPEVVEALSIIGQESTQALRQVTDNLDLKKDAEQLR